MQLIVGTARVAVFASLEDKIVNMFLVITNTVLHTYPSVLSQGEVGATWGRGKIRKFIKIRKSDFSTSQ